VTGSDSTLPLPRIEKLASNSAIACNVRTRALGEPMTIFMPRSRARCAASSVVGNSEMVMPSACDSSTSAMVVSSWLAIWTA
jgi:hypothetical protein